MGMLVGSAQAVATVSLCCVCLCCVVSAAEEQTVSSARLVGGESIVAAAPTWLADGVSLSVSATLPASSTSVQLSMVGTNETGDVTCRDGSIGWYIEVSKSAVTVHHQTVSVGALALAGGTDSVFVSATLKHTARGVCVLRVNNGAQSLNISGSWLCPAVGLNWWGPGNCTVPGQGFLSVMAPMDATIAAAEDVIAAISPLAPDTSPCNDPPSSPMDRRADQNRLVVTSYNLEFAFDGINDPKITPRKGVHEARMHLVKVSSALWRLNADVINLVEVENCGVLRTISQLLLPLPLTGYLVPGKDTYTKQNVALLTAVDPVMPLWRTEARHEYPVVGSACLGGCLSLVEQSSTESCSVKPKTTGVSKHYVAILQLLSGVKLGVVGLHFLSRPLEAEPCMKREAQASVLAKVVASTMEEESCVADHMFVLGDFNDYDGEVLDCNGAKDRPFSRVLAILKDPLSAYPGSELANVATLLPPDERFTSWYGRGLPTVPPACGRYMSSIDHILVSKSMLKQCHATASILHDTIPGASDHYPLSTHISGACLDMCGTLPTNTTSPGGLRMSPPIGTDTVSVDVLATLQPEEESNSDRGFRSKLELAAAAGAMLRDLLVNQWHSLRASQSELQLIGDSMLNVSVDAVSRGLSQASALTVGLYPPGTGLSGLPGGSSILPVSYGSCTHPWPAQSRETGVRICVVSTAQLENVRSRLRQHGLIVQDHIKGEGALLVVGSWNGSTKLTFAASNVATVDSDGVDPSWSPLLCVTGNCDSCDALKGCKQLQPITSTLPAMLQVVVGGSLCLMAIFLLLRKLRSVQSMQAVIADEDRRLRRAA